MLATYLGEAAFQKGLQIYLNRQKYTNATTQDLWTAWSEASGQDVSKNMHHWTKDVGYPVLQVERKTDKGCKLAVNQTRYLSSGQPTQEQDQTVWWIKVPIQGEHEQNVTFLDFSSSYVSSTFFD
jgi:aminopeptidase 2